MDAFDLLDEIDDLFQGVAQHADNSAKIEDLYEAFLMGLVLEAARRIDPQAVSWHRVDDVVAAEIRLRAGPGEIYTEPFTHAKLTFGDDLGYEVHLGVKVLGNHAAHECDVVVLHAAVAAARRHARSTPNWQDTLIALEAKAYVKTAVDIKLARQVVGACVDLGHQKLGLVAAKAIEPPASNLVNGWCHLRAWGPVTPGSPLADALLDALEWHLRL